MEVLDLQEVRIIFWIFQMEFGKSYAKRDKNLICSFDVTNIESLYDKISIPFHGGHRKLANNLTKLAIASATSSKACFCWMISSMTTRHVVET